MITEEAAKPVLDGLKYLVTTDEVIAKEFITLHDKLVNWGLVKKDNESLLFVAQVIMQKFMFDKIYGSTEAAKHNELHLALMQFVDVIISRRDVTLASLK